MTNEERKELVERLLRQTDVNADYANDLAVQCAAQIEADGQRIAELEELQTCACGYDNPTDICLGHARILERIDANKNKRIAELEIGVRNAQGDVVRACKRIIELEQHIDALAGWIEAAAISGTATADAWGLADKLMTKARAALGETK